MLLATFTAGWICSTMLIAAIKRDVEEHGQRLR